MHRFIQSAARWCISALFFCAASSTQAVLITYEYDGLGFPTPGSNLQGRLLVELPASYANLPFANRSLQVEGYNFDNTNGCCLSFSGNGSANNNVDFFRFSTDANGNIDHWAIWVTDSNGQLGFITASDTVINPVRPTDAGAIDYFSNVDLSDSSTPQYFARNNSGHWSRTGGPEPVLEVATASPGTLALLLAGICLLLWNTRRSQADYRTRITR